MTAPTIDPYARDEVAAADSYRVGEPVWVWRDGAWRQGTVRGVGPRAVLVDFQSAKAGGVATDTVRAEYVMRRPEQGAAP